MTALQRGASEIGIGAGGSLSGEGRAFIAATAGETFGRSDCADGGSVSLVYVRAYTPPAGNLDVSALKAVFGNCVTGGTPSLQLSGELTLSGHYVGPRAESSVRVSGSLTTASGSCAVDAGLGIIGSFSGTACGTDQQTNPRPASPAAQAAVGAYTLRSLDGLTFPFLYVTAPCDGYMDSGTLTLSSDGTYQVSMTSSFVCMNGPGPTNIHTEVGRWSMLVENTVVFATVNTTLFNAAPGALAGSVLTVVLDVPTGQPGLQAPRMTAVFGR
jgi:hypothetical protein